MGTKIIPTTYGHIAILFLKVGARAFSGWPMAALIVEKELVEKERILTKKQYQGAFAYAHFIPGATQVAFISHVGYDLKGFLGSALATVCYLLPALTLMVIFAVVYFRYLQGMHFAAHIAGVSAALGGILLANAYRIGKGGASRSLLWLAVIVAFALKFWFDVNAAVIILMFGVGSVCVSVVRSRREVS
jgi:chromate transporter